MTTKTCGLDRLRTKKVVHTTNNFSYISKTAYQYHTRPNKTYLRLVRILESSLGALVLQHNILVGNSLLSYCLLASLRALLVLPNTSAR